MDIKPGEAIKFLRDECGFRCGDPSSQISRAWAAIEGLEAKSMGLRIKAIRCCAEANDYGDQRDEAIARADRAEDNAALLTAANIAYAEQVAKLIGRAGNAEAEVARLRQLLGGQA